MRLKKERAAALVEQEKRKMMEAQMIANNVPDIDEMVEEMYQNKSRKLSANTEDESDFTAVMVPIRELIEPTDELKAQEVTILMQAFVTITHKYNYT